MITRLASGGTPSRARSVASGPSGAPGGGEQDAATSRQANAQRMSDRVIIIRLMPELRQFTCNLCDAMCGLDVTIDGNRVTDIRADPEDVFSRGHICPKGPALRELLEDPDRLRAPVRRTASGWEPIGWDEAFAE